MYKDLARLRTKEWGAVKIYSCISIAFNVIAKFFERNASEAVLCANICVRIVCERFCRFFPG